MRFLPFESRNELYKTPFGAVEENAEVTFRLLLHDDARCREAFLLYCADGGEFIYKELSPAEYLEGGFRFYTTTLNFSEGLYFYKFLFHSEFGTKQITRFKNGEGFISDQGELWQLTVYESGFETPKDLEGGIIYQIFPDRFYRSGLPKQNVPHDRFLRDNTNEMPEYRQNNGACSLGNDYFGGDLEGIRQKLPYLSSLGVSIIYLNPIFEAHSNHRYNTADYTKIDPLLGTEEDFKSLCREAKGFGIKIILDGVFSHTGDDSIYFNKYRRYGDDGAYNSKESPFYGWFKFDAWPDRYSAWWGVPSLPETHEENEAFCEYIAGENGVLRRWLRLGASGWRLDVADELPDSFLDKIRLAVKAENPNAYILGEVWEDATNKISYGVRRRYLRGRQLDAVMNYPFATAIIKFVTGGDAFELCDSIMTVCENYPRKTLKLLMNHIGTHDTMRILTALGGEPDMGRGRAWQSGVKMTPIQIENGKKLLYLAVLLQYTLPGLPSVYYGDEAGMEGYGDPFCRGFFPWGNEDPYLVEFYKKLGELRRSSSAFADGDFCPLFSGLGLFAFIRKCCNEQVLVALNRWHEQDTLEVPPEWESAEAVFGRTPENGRVTVDGKGFVVLRLKG